MPEDDSDLLSGLENTLKQNSDMAKAMEEFFKDKADVERKSVV